MSNYTRFVSYLYEYKNGTKSENRGFIKVESRDNLCKMQVHIKNASQPANNPLNIYGFTHLDGKLAGMLLGGCQAGKGTTDYKLEFPTERINDTEHSFNDLSGILIFDDSNICYGTSWDDNPIIVSSFYQVQPTAAPLQPETPEEAVWENTAPAEELSTHVHELAFEDESTASQTASQQDLAPSQMMAAEVSTPSQMAPVLEEDTFSQMSPSESGFMPENPVPLGMSYAQQESLLQQEIPNPQQPASYAREPEDAYAFRQFQDTPETYAASESSNYQDGPRPEMHATSASAAAVNPLPQSVDRWEQLQSTYNAISPFADDEITECIQLELKDLPDLRKNNWLIGNNQFILHSFSNYKHLIIGKMASPDSTVYILGIPGNYDPKEKFMANMFGFPYFKSAAERNLQSGQFGYWYRPIN